MSYKMKFLQLNFYANLHIVLCIYSEHETLTLSKKHLLDDGESGIDANDDG